jgi:D-serine deaminase-like pyridoxal phosphate-dependent protein
VADEAYRRLRAAFAGRTMPFAFVDLRAFDANAARTAARAAGKPVRVATKSLRSAALIRRALASSPVFRGLMAYHPAEAVWLARQGFDDVLLGYPCWDEREIEAMCAAVRDGAGITAMVDLPEHVERLAMIAARVGTVLPVCLDVDMSSRFPGLHFGVRRSSITTPTQALALFRQIQAYPGLRLEGVMGYEAQIAGVPDAVPGQGPRNAAVRALKAASAGEVAKRRAEVVLALRGAGAPLRFVNGGGTGSFESTGREDVVTELTAGSAFYAPALFDGYKAFHYQPAAGFAIAVTRKPEPGIVTCSGGGYVASGEAGPGKLPRVWLPGDASLLPLEGAGEVQTPVRLGASEAPGLGDPVFMRHAKAGELCERFETLLLLDGEAVVDEVRTYRGEGLCFG